MRRLHARNRVDSKPNFTTNPPEMDPIKFQIRSNSRSTALFSRNPRQTKPTPALIVILIIMSLALMVFSYIFLFSSAEFTKFGIIIDGGSSGTRIHVFRYRVDGYKNLVFDFKEVANSLKINPGLSAYGKHPEAISVYLGELLEFGKRNIPRKQWGETEIRLMATAGMRLLDVELQERILEECRKVLRVSGFKFHDDWASVITGSDEGVYAWVVANYALGTLGGNPLDTTGIIELGGASAQVTFVSSEFMPSKFSRSIKFANFTYNLYSHSFLHFGQDVAHESLRESLVKGDISPAADFQKEMYIDPCTPRGYLPLSSNLSPHSMAEKSKYSSELQASGNFSECRSAALKLLQKGKEKCSNHRCYLGSVFMPKLQGKFLATENFFHTSKFFKLPQRAFLSDLMMAGQHFCGEDWSKLKKKHQSLNEEELLRYCFSSAYIVALLHDSLGIALDDERVSFANQVDNIPLDWALGAFILQSTARFDEQQTDWISTIISYDSPTLFSIIAISAVLMPIAWYISKWRRPQLKTIYDLEKGRYIVTRIGRS